MEKRNRVKPKYQGMLEAGREQPVAANAVSDTQAELMEADRGALWSLEVTERVYRTGGNEGDWDPGYHGNDPKVGPDPT